MTKTDTLPLSTHALAGAALRRATFAAHREVDLIHHDAGLILSALSRAGADPEASWSDAIAGLDLAWVALGILNWEGICAEDVARWPQSLAIAEKAWSQARAAAVERGW